LSDKKISMGLFCEYWHRRRNCQPGQLAVTGIHSNERGKLTESKVVHGD
jgi:hypothetical protein